ncbi:hypothetical protein NECAME_01531 [Necator americanus]|uniref:Uncharacterized protein n=1 Tax=Necator americanus TaxID=51031 RepID=W2TTI4_NECAM|nr:hypothetical protein NECAME_01531 [Necator americanus]ETN84969.1 hypothetical protein NECAME_01531 [Necator americanus]
MEFYSLPDSAPRRYYEVNRGGGDLWFKDGNLKEIYCHSIDLIIARDCTSLFRDARMYLSMYANDR